MTPILNNLKMIRMNWNANFWLKMAEQYATGSKDPSTKVGCVIVRPDKTSCSWGTNGFPRNVKDCPTRIANRDTKLELTVHAELNALLFAREPVAGYTLYSTFAPCIRCAVAIIQSGISKVVFYNTDNDRWKEEQKRSVALLQEAGIVVISVDRDA